MIIHIKDQEPGTFIRIPDHEGACSWNSFEGKWVPLNELKGLPHVVEATSIEQLVRTFGLIDCKYKMLITYTTHPDLAGAMIAADSLFIKTDRTIHIKKENKDGKM